jgi:hypothetical protein
MGVLQMIPTAAVAAFSRVSLVIKTNLAEVQTLLVLHPNQEPNSIA